MVRGAELWVGLLYYVTHTLLLYYFTHISLLQRMVTRRGILMGGTKVGGQPARGSYVSTYEYSSKVVQVGVKKYSSKKSLDCERVVLLRVLYS